MIAGAGHRYLLPAVAYMLHVATTVSLVHFRVTDVTNALQGTETTAHSRGALSFGPRLSSRYTAASGRWERNFRELLRVDLYNF
jgi:hypothetical protein